MKQIINYYGLSFELDDNTFTAKIIDSSNVAGDVFIPRSVRFRDNDYIITVIGKYSFKSNKNVNSIHFSEDSGLLLIEKKAFFRSSINTFYLPSSIQKLESGWCNSTPKLVSISVPSQNKYFLFYEGKYLLGKTIENGEEFDLLLFASRNIGQGKIPPFIKQIDKYAFCDCKSIESIDFDENSKLEKIKKSAFFKSSIQKVHLPSNLKEIEEGWCKSATKITSITISPNNHSFSYYKDRFLLGKSNQNNEKFDVLLYSRHDIKQVTIPSQIERISSYSFNECKHLKKVEFQSDSVLQSIGKRAFSLTSIEKVKIPSSVNSIEKAAFLCCRKLKSVELNEDSKLSIFSERVFDSTSIERIFIPSNVIKLDKLAFNSCNSLKSIEFSDDSKLQSIGKNALTLTSIEHIRIPSTVIEIEEESFTACYSLKTVEFSNHSKLKIIGKSAFSSTSLENIIIPSTVEKIYEKAFCKCVCLRSVEFEKDSKLQSFEAQIFDQSYVQSISIPSRLKELKEGWCCGTKELINISVSPENEHFKFYENRFLIGKSDEKSDSFDILYFARRDIEHAIVPSFIRQINSFAFYECRKLNSVEFSANSKLISIKNNSFSYSTIEKIFIPSTVSEIEEFAFAHCYNLHKIDNYENTQIRSIENETFSSLDILSIPSTVVELKDGWCGDATNLIRIHLDPNNPYFSYVDDKFLIGKSEEKSDNFDILLFARRDLNEAVIPSFIKKVCSYAFFSCKLKYVEFESNSKVKSIEKYAFCATQFRNVFIPSRVTKIGECAFYNCKNLKSIDFDNDSELSIIEKYAFGESSIRSLSVPKNVRKIEKMTFIACYSISAIEFLGNEIEFEVSCFDQINANSIISIPNAQTIINFENLVLGNKNLNLSIFVSSSAKKL